MSFYDDLAKMASDLLAPAADGGLGQGTIELVRTAPGVPDPAKPWEPVVGTEDRETLRAAARGVDARMVGTEVGGAVLVATDLVVTAAAPALDYQPGDVLEIDGAPVVVLGIEKIPAVGTTVAVRFILRR